MPVFVTLFWNTSEGKILKSVLGRNIDFYFFAAISFTFNQIQKKEEQILKMIFYVKLDDENNITCLSFTCKNMHYKLQNFWT